MDENQLQDICRVCRSEATPEKPLYHPCICTGSIKFIHQECLLQWLKYSRKEYCELCSHRFSFMPIYSPDMPKRLPIKDIISGLLCSLGTAIRFWLHYTLVAVAWLGIVPLTACRIYRCLFTGSLSSIITLPFDILSTFNFADNSTQIANARENILSDSLYGCCVVTCTLCAFISLVWLREQILHGGGPEWLEHEHDVVHAGDPPADAPNNNVQMNIHHQHPPIPAVALNPVQGDHPPPPSHAAVPNSNQDDCPPSPSSSSIHESHQSSNVYDNTLSSSNTNYHDHTSQNSAHQHSSHPCSNSENFSSTSDSTHHQHLHSASAENFVQQRRHSPSPPPHSIQHSPNAAHQHPSPANSVQYPLSTTSLSHQHSVPSPSSVNAAHHQHTTTNFVKHQRSSPSPPPTSVHDQLYSPNASASSIQQPPYVVPSNTPQHSPPSTPPAASVQNHYSFPSNSVHAHNSASANIDQHQRSSSSPPSISSHHQHATSSFANSDHHPSSTASPHAAPHQPFPPIPYFQDADDDDDSAQEDDVDANEGNNGAEDVNNWNPIEWDHAAEELTWERLLGLDGSLVFLEHVFWVVSLNTLFIVVFAFFPYHIGQFALSCFGFQEYVKAPEFEGLLTTLFGYINIGIALALLHGAAALIRLNRTRRLFGICYVVIKVSLLSVVEIGIFPLVCGWWLDICSLTLLDATIHDREAGFKLAPGTSMFIHWLAGMVYVFYFASFILLLREVLRPGVLWFLKNLNDPDFNPIQEMIHSPILRHIRRVLISLVTFGTTILLVVWLPVRIIEKITPSFLPYQVMLANDMPYSELSLELVLLQVVMPALLEQGHMRNWLKFSVRSWCIGVSYILDIRSYLLGDVNSDEQQGDGSNVPAPAPAPAAENEGQEGFQGGALAAVHQALFQPVSPVFQPYKRPKFLPFKIVCLIILICISLTLASLVMFTVPVYIGRKVMSLWLGNTKIHELYTIGCGMYVCWMTLRISTLLWSWIPKGWASISLKLKEIFIIAVKLVCAMSMLLVVIPILMGLTLDMIVTVPIRVCLNQTPLISLWQDWAIGVLLTKTFFAIVLVSPDWWMKRVIEQVYMGGVRNINLKLIFLDLSLPIIITLGLSLSVPYIIACSIIPMFTSNFEVQNTVLRRIYPSLLGLVLIVEGIIFHVRQFCRLYEHIKNDKYLVGKRLVNYEHQRLPEASQAREEAPAAS